ncbi:MAG: hypothetical protein ABGX05_06440, partial [Pirellulaceae bacterium]
MKKNFIVVVMLIISVFGCKKRERSENKRSPVLTAAQRKETIAALKLLGGEVKKDANGHISVISLSKTRVTNA